MRRAAAVLSRVLVGAAVAGAVLMSVPSPNIGLALLALVANELSLILAAIALAGLVGSLASRRRVAALLAALALAVTLLPTIGVWEAAREWGVSLSVGEQLTGGLASRRERSPATVTYATVEGQPLRLDVWQPAGSGAGRRPAVVNVHGGSWEWGRRGELARWNTWLAARGFVVFDVDYRLAPPPRWRDAPGDVKCALGWVTRNAGRYGVDPDRIALMGSSAGGHLALVAAYTLGDDALPPSCEGGGAARAVVTFGAPTDLTRLGPLENFVGGTPETAPDAYRIASPITHVRRGVPPTLLLHGGGDQLVPAEHAEAFAERLDRAGVPHELVMIPRAEHGFEFHWGGWGSQISRPVVARFLTSHLA